jgi:uncharacterized membrane protein
LVLWKVQDVVTGVAVVVVVVAVVVAEEAEEEGEVKEIVHLLFKPGILPSLGPITPGIAGSLSLQSKRP